MGGAQPCTLEHGLVRAHPPPSGGSPPTSQVCSIELQMGQLIVTGYAQARSEGSVIAGVEVTVDGGRRWRRAENDDKSWEFKMSWAQDKPKQHLVSSRAVDDCGRIEDVLVGQCVGGSRL